LRRHAARECGADDREEQGALYPLRAVKCAVSRAIEENHMLYREGKPAALLTQQEFLRNRDRIVMRNEGCGANAEMGEQCLHQIRLELVSIADIRLGRGTKAKQIGEDTGVIREVRRDTLPIPRRGWKAVQEDERRMADGRGLPESQAVRAGPALCGQFGRIRRREFEWCLHALLTSSRHACREPPPRITVMRMRIIHDAEIVAAAAKTGVLRTAAAELGLAQSNVSRRIAALERRLGVTLLARSGRGVSLTDAGRAYLTLAREGLAALDAAEAAARQLGVKPQGLLRVTAPLAFGRRMVAPAAAQFVRLHPEIRLDLHFDDAVVDLVAAGFDLAIRLGKPAGQLQVTRVWRRSHLRLVAAPVYLESRAPVTAPAELAGHDFIVVAPTPARTRWRLKGPGGAMISVHAPATHVANDIEAALELVRGGIGASLLPDWLVSADLGGGRLAEILPGWTGPSYDARLVLPAGSAVTAKTRAFIEYLTR
jgi:DNA-binding transcriptional LysR family regulator